MADRYASVAGAGAHDGSSAANAWTMAEATANVAAGDDVYVLAGSQIADDSASGAVMDLDVAGTVGAWITWIAYTTTIGDFTPGDAQPVIINAGTNTLTHGMLATTIAASAYNRFVGFQFTGGSSHGVNGGTSVDNMAFVGCKFDNNGGRGFAGDDGWTFLACEFTANTTNAGDADNDTVFESCLIHAEAISTAVLTIQAAYLGRCLFYDNGNGINVRCNGVLHARNNTLDGDGQAGSIGFQTSGSVTIPHIITNNILFDFLTGVDFANAGINEVRARGYNLFYSNTNDYDTIALDDTDIAGTEDPFTNSATRDYTLKDSGEAQGAGLDAGTLTGTSYMDIGALQKQITGGSASGVRNPLRGPIG